MKGTALQFTYIERWTGSCRIEATNQSTRGRGLKVLTAANQSYGQDHVLAASWARPQPCGNGGWHTSPLSARPKGRRSQARIGRRCHQSWAAGPAAHYIQAFLDSGGQEIFQKSRWHGWQYVFIVIDGMRAQLRGKLTLTSRGRRLGREAPQGRGVADSPGASES